MIPVHTQIKPIENVQEGMVLARDVKDHSGIILVSKETVLTEQILRSLRKKDIRMLTVVDTENREYLEAEIEAEEQSARGDLLARFREPPESPLMEALCNAALRIEALMRLDNEQNS
jgi:hypothetical protein